MSGHVFHPGHAELHGITVVLETAGDAVFIGRYHEENEAGVLLHDVAEYRPSADGPTRDDFVKKTLRFGVRAQHRHLLVPKADVRKVSRLAEWG